MTDEQPGDVAAADESAGSPLTGGSTLAAVSEGLRTADRVTAVVLSGVLVALLALLVEFSGFVVGETVRAGLGFLDTHVVERLIAHPIAIAFVIAFALFLNRWLFRGQLGSVNRFALTAKGVALGVGVGLAIAVTAVLSFRMAGAGRFVSFDQSSWFVAIVAALAVTARSGFVQEIAYRYVLYGWLRNRAGIRWAAVLSGVAGVSPSLIRASDNTELVFALLGGVAMGVLFATLYEATGSIVPGAIVHTTCNATTSLTGFSLWSFAVRPEPAGHYLRGGLDITTDQAWLGGAQIGANTSVLIAAIFLVAAALIISRTVGATTAPGNQDSDRTARRPTVLSAIVVFGMTIGAVLGASAVAVVQSRSSIADAGRDGGATSLGGDTNVWVVAIALAIAALIISTAVRATAGFADREATGLALGPVGHPERPRVGLGRSLAVTAVTVALLAGLVGIGVWQRHNAITYVLHQNNPLADPVDEGTGVEWFDDYYTIEEVAPRTYAIGEPRYWQRNYNYLVIGEDRALLIDAGPGLRDIRPVVESLTDLPYSVTFSHFHFDHVGDGRDFPETLVVDLPHLRARVDGDTLPIEPPEHLGRAEAFIEPTLEIDGWIDPNGSIDLGGRTLDVIYTPGHTTESVSFYDPTTNILFSGDWFTEALGPFVNNSNMEGFLRAAQRVECALPNDVEIRAAHKYVDGGGAPDVLDMDDVRDSITALERIRRSELSGTGPSPSSTRSTTASTSSPTSNDSRTGPQSTQNYSTRTATDSRQGGVLPAAAPTGTPIRQSGDAIGPDRARSLSQPPFPPWPRSSHRALARPPVCVGRVQFPSSVPM